MAKSATKRRILLSLISCACLAAGSAPLPAQGTSSTDPLAPLRASWIKALQQKNLNASIALYEPDAVFLTPDGGRYVARDAIRGLYQNLMAAYSSQMAMFSKRQQCSGDLCVDDGEYSESLAESASGKKTQLAGSYLMVARRAHDGTWRISEITWTIAQGTHNP